MPGLASRELLDALLRNLPTGSYPTDPGEEVRPAHLSIPKLGLVCVYLWTATLDRSRGGARPPEAKIQLKLPGQAPRTRARLEFGVNPTVLLGYVADLDMFVG